MFRLFTLLLGLCLAVLGAAVLAQDGPQHPIYISSESCAECHTAETEDWQGSDHSWAWRPATGENVLGDFDNATFEHQGITTRFFTEDNTYWIETDDEAGARQKYQIEYIVGVKPLQQYLIRLEQGRFQVLDIAWDTEAKRWYMVFPDHPNNVPGNAIHWSGVYKNWNGRCAECHATEYYKNYDLESRSFYSEWSEIGVGCEACHGPGEAHWTWAQDPDIADLKAYLGVDDQGLVEPATKGKQTQEMQMCAGCHSRRTTLTGDTPMPGSHFANNFDLATLRPGLYHPDGQILDEVYVFGSFKQSKMFAAGVTCSDCHNPHSGEVKAQDNGLCTQCHSTEGNTGFPSLVKKDYDTTDHHNHPDGSDGAQCVSCHMPETTYMQVDPRRDHRFGIPSPETSLAIGTPNACTTCHEDRDAAWAASVLGDWFSQSSLKPEKFALVFSLAQNAPDTPGLAGDLLSLASDDLPAIIRASALDRLQLFFGGFDWAAAAVHFRDPDPQVRTSAARLFLQAPPEVKMEFVYPSLKDGAKAVRVAAARTLVSVPASSMTETQRRVMSEAMSDFYLSLTSSADHPSTQMAMAGLALTFRNLEAAKAAVNEALLIDPQLEDGWIMRSNIENAERRPDLVQKTLAEALKQVPESATLHQFFGNYLAGQRQYDASVALLKRAVELSGKDRFVRTDLATVLMYAGRFEPALVELDVLLEEDGTDATALFLKANALLRLGRTEESGAVVETLLEIDPDFVLPDELKP